jgi:hypothetical protein
MFFDPAADILGVKASPKDDDTSPRTFIRHQPVRSVAVVEQLPLQGYWISNKDRASIMLAGKLGKAYWYHEGVAE